MAPSTLAEDSPSHPNARLRSLIGTFPESVVQYGLVVYAFLLPFAKLSHVLEYAFLGLLVVWVAVKASRGELAWQRTALGLPLLLFLGWVLFTTAFAIDPSYSFSEWRKSVTRVLMFFFVASAISEERQVRHIVLACVIGCIVQAAGALHASVISHNVPWHSLWYREAGWTSASQWLSTYLIMILPLFALAARFEARPFIRWVYAAGSVLVLAALFFAQTRAAWVALIVQLLVLGALHFKRSGVHATVAGALAVALLIVITAVPGPLRTLFMQGPFTNTSTMLIRFNTWKLAVDQIASRPITGLGYGRHSFQHVLPENPPEPLHTHVHNTFLSSAVQLGIPGFALLLWIFGGLVRECFESWKVNADRFESQLALAVLLSTVGVIVRNMFDDMFVGTLVYLFWLLAGLHFALKRRRVAPGGPIPGAPRGGLE